VCVCVCVCVCERERVLLRRIELSPPPHLTIIHVDLEEHNLARVGGGEVDELGGDHLRGPNGGD